MMRKVDRDRERDERGGGRSVIAATVSIAVTGATAARGRDDRPPSR